MTLQELASRKSSAKAKAVDSTAAADHLKALNGWGMKGKEITKTYSFKNYYETIAFVNAIAFIANQEDHHPDMEVGYNKCTVKFSTHSVGGLSENDFICAAKVERLLSA